MDTDIRHGERGTTLLEAVVAAGLFGLAMAAMSPLLVTHIRMEGSNLTRTTAIGLAERELEDLRALNYDDITSRSSTQMIASMQYTVATTVRNDTPTNGVKTITTVVSWNDQLGAERYALNAVYTAVKR
jgi:Tfp pilus assembly protein PilV